MAAGCSRAGSTSGGGAGGGLSGLSGPSGNNDSKVLKEVEEDMYRWIINATASSLKDLVGKPTQYIKFEFKQPTETGGERFSWTAWSMCSKKGRSKNILCLIVLALAGGKKCIPEERLFLKVKNTAGTKIFQGIPGKWDSEDGELRETHYAWKITVTEKLFQEFQMHGGGLIVTFILKTKILTTEKLYWPSELDIMKKRYKMISKLENDEENSDFKIISSDGKEFYAYQWILAGVSDVFEAMFRCDMKERESGVLKMDDLSGTTVKILLHFIYSGEVASEWSSAEIVEELIYGTEKYQIEDLRNFLDAKLATICTADNAGALLAMAEKTSLKKAVADILAFIKEQCKEPKGFFEIVKKTKID